MEKITIEKMMSLGEGEKVNRVVDMEKYSFESVQELSLRPNVWEEYIGQEKIKKNLKVFIEASKKRKECLDHILFFWTTRSW